MTQWYEELFSNYAKKYDEESFTQGTQGECDFIEDEAGHDRSLRILDIGCGTGRHAIELTKRGYKVTGIDLSESQLKRAREKALDAGLESDFRQADARNLPFKEEFDLAIMLCEGGFPLMETDEMNYDILKSAARALKLNSKFIFTTLNGLFPIFHSLQKFYGEETKDDDATYHDNTFDIMTFRDHNITVFEDDDGNKHELTCNERFYIPSEITWLLKTLNFKTIEFFSAKLGEFSRKDPLTPDNFEMLVIASKSY